MPQAKLVEAVNTTLSTAGVQALLADNGDILERLAEPGALFEVAQSLLGLPDDTLEYIESIPAVLQEAIRGGILEALNQGKGVHLQYSPAYDFGLRMWDFGEAVSIHISGPYPDSLAAP